MYHVLYFADHRREADRPCPFDKDDETPLRCVPPIHVSESHSRENRIDEVACEDVLADHVVSIDVLIIEEPLHVLLEYLLEQPKGAAVEVLDKCHHHQEEHRLLDPQVDLEHRIWCLERIVDRSKDLHKPEKPDDFQEPERADHPDWHLGVHELLGAAVDHLVPRTPREAHLRRMDHQKLQPGDRAGRAQVEQEHPLHVVECDDCELVLESPLLVVEAHEKLQAQLQYEKHLAEEIELERRLTPARWFVPEEREEDRNREEEVQLA
mmetsp:Transcript_8232/g.19139  ORF Transcript_8232/g.19139 Transcript_8232/m.19139 type:complete len:266 (-) Transcript_8232:837-1634(-)